MTPLVLALIDDYEVVVEGLASMMRSYQDRIRIVELDANATVATPVDIALYDSFANPQGDSPQVRELAANPNVAKTVVYTWKFDQRSITRALANGADGYVAKSLAAAELVTALESIHRGEQRVHPTGRASRKVVAGDWPGREEGLTHREAEMLALITQGLSNEMIAERTALSINSVKTHIRSCYRRIGVTTRTQAVLWGVDHGFLPDRSRRSGDDV
ncbi:LuxR C-terminal-related transcriptional regulator [Gordonia phthalatica]|uniref:LuxR C-terminal-related transcriptional regulator n=1 Tax=Gordonia phthalatica TaxID=1136941 RepID=UPI00187306FB|nr:response regulator transcription factor [Gordonia phthalatica]